MTFTLANISSLLQSSIKIPEFFSEALDVLAGKITVPVSGGSFKVLDFMFDEMLNSNIGCDATITPTQFELRFPGNSGPHDYIPEIAPGVLQQLLLWCQTDSITESFHSSFGPVTTQGPYGLNFEKHFLWIQQSDQRIDLKIRTAQNPQAILTDDCPVCRSIVSTLLCRPCLACTAEWKTSS